MVHKTHSNPSLLKILALLGIIIVSYSLYLYIAEALEFVWSRKRFTDHTTAKSFMQISPRDIFSSPDDSEDDVLFIDSSEDVDYGPVTATVATITASVASIDEAEVGNGGISACLYLSIYQILYFLILFILCFSQTPDLVCQSVPPCCNRLETFLLEDVFCPLLGHFTRIILFPFILL